MAAVGALPAGSGTISIDAAKPGAQTSPRLYGIFFEEISHAGDGGLYGELIQNRGFEDASLPPACRREGNRIVPPRTPHYWIQPRVSDWTMPWDVTSKWPGWSLAITGGARATIDLVDDQPLTEATPHSLMVAIASVPKGGRAALINEGYWGISVGQGEAYRLSFYIRSDRSFRGRVTATIESKNGKLLASQVFANTPSASWRKYEAILTATGTDPRARFALSFGSAGKVWVDFVSLFPVKTFHDRPNGMRPDIARMIAGMKPGFMRFPGGCYVEGITIQSRPQWQASLGRLEDRPGTYSPWGYWSTNGIGYHEFLQFAEDIGAEPLYVVNAGISCAFRSGTFIPDDQLEPLIQDTLDAVEYATGPVSSKWGALRARAGHPKPFPLKYLEVGNEDQGARYGERFARFYRAIKAKYPGMNVILDSWIAGIDRGAIRGAGKFELLDEHAYKPLYWSVENFDSFSKYKREGWDLYIGEFATNAGVGRGNLAAALGDAAYMMSMEKNSDLVKMGSYAPLLENVNKPDWEVNLVRFDSSRVFGRASYYVCKLFAENRADVNLPTTVTYEPSSDQPVSGAIGVGTYNTAADFTDIRVESEGRVLYRSDFSRSAEGWQPETGRETRGEWSVDHGMYRQKDHAVARSWFGDPNWRNVTVSLKARRVSGAEGFVVVLGSVDNRRIQWNVGGWGNRQTAVEANDEILGAPVFGGVEAGRWYDARVEVRGRTLRCYLDGKLMNEVTAPRVDTVLAIAGRDEKTGEIIIKTLNTGSEAASMSFEIAGAERISSHGDLIRLTSRSPQDENSFEEPRKIVPTVIDQKDLGPRFAAELPPWSLSIFRAKTR